MVGVTVQTDNRVHRMAVEDPVPWFRKRNLRYLYFMLFPCLMGIEMTSGFDSQIINAVQLVPAWTDWGYKGILASALPLGAVIGLPLIPLVNDNLGRRWCVLTGSVIMIIGSLIQGFAINAPMYIIARLIIGFGLPYAIVAGSSLIGELAYPKERAVLTSLFNAAYFVGAIVASGVTYGTQLIPSDWSWRVPSLLQLSPSLLQVVFIFFIPESPRFLISKDKHEEAFKVIVKYHAEGDENSEFAKAEMAEIKTTIAIELEHSKRSWLDMVSTAGNRRRLLIGSLVGVMTQLSGNVVISYYLGDILALVGFTDPQFAAKYNIGNQVWGLVCAVITALIVMRFRRRTMYLFAICWILTAYVGWTASAAVAIERHNNAAAKLTLFWIYFYQPGYNIGFNALTYSKRENFFGTNVNPVGLDPVNGIGWKFLIVYSVWILVEGLLIYFLWPETSGRTLEELAFLFEDDERARKAEKAVESEIHKDSSISDDKGAEKEVV
ncbi:hypothetical protein EKO27_g6565 [Xylaria grammica]|uniref:Major facilitator superfamily (MFS) profile domain-containing protein n=1 Tax=Xylaria grammica TaxID=363999 RepID=A0A439D2A2_9PEZI|nr:hypothetical protein EKO27_g6565 [Xylaria grammica]